MKFVNFISVVLVAIFSLFMSSANAEPQGVGCAIINGVEVCGSNKKQNITPQEYVSPSGNKYTMPLYTVPVDESKVTGSAVSAISAVPVAPSYKQ